MRKYRKGALIIGGISILIAATIFGDLRLATALALMIPAYAFVLFMREAGEEIKNWDRCRSADREISSRNGQKSAA